MGTIDKTYPGMTGDIQAMVPEDYIPSRVINGRSYEGFAARHEHYWQEPRTSPSSDKLAGRERCEFRSRTTDRYGVKVGYRWLCYVDSNFPLLEGSKAKITVGQRFHGNPDVGEGKPMWFLRYSARGMELLLNSYVTGGDSRLVPIPTWHKGQYNTVEWEEIPGSGVDGWFLKMIVNGVTIINEWLTLTNSTNDSDNHMKIGAYRSDMFVWRDENPGQTPPDQIVYYSEIERAPNAVFTSSNWPTTTQPQPPTGPTMPETPAGYTAASALVLDRAGNYNWGDTSINGYLPSWQQGPQSIGTPSRVGTVQADGGILLTGGEGAPQDFGNGDVRTWRAGSIQIKRPTIRGIGTFGAVVHAKLANAVCAVFGHNDTTKKEGDFELTKFDGVRGWSFNLWLTNASGGRVTPNTTRTLKRGPWADRPQKLEFREFANPLRAEFWVDDVLIETLTPADYPAGTIWNQADVMDLFVICEKHIYPDAVWPGFVQADYNLGASMILYSVMAGGTTGAANANTGGSTTGTAPATVTTNSYTVVSETPSAITYKITPPVVSGNPTPTQTFEAKLDGVDVRSRFNSANEITISKIAAQQVLALTYHAKNGVAPDYVRYKDITVPASAATSTGTAPALVTADSFTVTETPTAVTVKLTPPVLSGDPTPTVSYRATLGTVDVRSQFNAQNEATFAKTSAAQTLTIQHRGLNGVSPDYSRTRTITIAAATQSQPTPTAPTRVTSGAVDVVSETDTQIVYRITEPTVSGTPTPTQTLYIDLDHIDVKAQLAADKTLTIQKKAASQLLEVFFGASNGVQPDYSSYRSATVAALPVVAPPPVMPVWAAQSGGITYPVTQNANDVTINVTTPTLSEPGTPTAIVRREVTLDGNPIAEAGNVFNIPMTEAAQEFVITWWAENGHHTPQFYRNSFTVPALPVVTPPTPPTLEQRVTELERQVGILMAQ